MHKVTYIISLALALSSVATAQTSVSVLPNEAQTSRYASISQEVLRAIEKGNEFIKQKQSKDGYWTDAKYPALTALAITAALRAPQLDGKPTPEYVQKGLDYIISCQKEDGSIVGQGLAGYNTSVSLMALLAANKTAYEPAILKSRAYLVKIQNNFGADNPYSGGIGYGGDDAPPIADLSNTTLALEAIHYSKKLAQDGKYGAQPDLDWQAAQDFISRCQQLPDTNKAEWVSTDPAQRGGFVYRPGESKASPDSKLGEQKKEPLRSYGSMTYAGLQSLVYADMKHDDQRVTAALAWLASNYTLDENPGMGAEGLYYYYQAMAKALSALGKDTLTLQDGKTIDWRDALATKLVSLQKEDGSWVNTNNRWWEADPVLVTAYTILALEQIYHSISAPPKK